MRSYIACYCYRANWSDPPFPPNPPAGGFIGLWDATADGLAAQVLNFSQAVAGRTMSIIYAGPAFITLSRTNVINMASDIGNSGSDGVPHVTESPRAEWYPGLNGPDDHYHGPESKDPGGLPEGEKPPVSGPQQGGVPVDSVLQYLLTLYSICVVRGCLGYASTINNIIKTNHTDDPNHYTQAQIDSAARAYNACIGLS